MKIRIHHAGETGDKDMTITIPTGLLFTRVGMYFLSRLMASAARREYDRRLEEMWHASADVDDLISIDDVQRAERLEPPITQEQARELFAALKESKYLLRGLPLVSMEHPDGTRLRIDL